MSVLWQHEDDRGARVFLAVSDPDVPKYELVIDSHDPEYLANELLTDLSRADLVALMAALREHVGVAVTGAIEPAEPVYAEDGVADPEGLRRELATVLNRYSAENCSNTPDFLLAEFLATALTAFDVATRARDRWYGVELAPGCGWPRP